MSFAAESDLEQRIVADSEWQEGAAWGEPRRGHPEGAVAAHVEEVLANIDQMALDAHDRERRVRGPTTRGDRSRLVPSINGASSFDAQVLW